MQKNHLYAFIKSPHEPRKIPKQVASLIVFFKILSISKISPLCFYKKSVQTKEDSKGGKPLAVLRGRVQREGENRNFSSLCAFFAILSWHQESMKKRKKIEFF